MCVCLLVKVRGQFVGLIFSTIDLRVRLVCRLRGKYVYLLSDLTDPFRKDNQKQTIKKNQNMVEQQQKPDQVFHLH